MTAKKSAQITSAILYAVVGFQLLVVAGAPLGRYTQGGQIDGTLPASGRMMALISAGLLLVMAFSVKALVNEGPLRNLAPRLIRRLAWITAIYSLVGTVMNSISRSPAERPWAFITLAGFFFTYRTLKLTK